MVDDLPRAASRLRVYLDTLTDRGTPEARLFRYLLNAQSPDGSWSGTPWTDVCTARAIELFGKIGLRLDTQWDIKDATGEVRGSGGGLAAIDYLTKSFSDGERWGNDWFDHAQVLRVLAKLSRTQPQYISNELAHNISLAQDSLRQALENDFAPDNYFAEVSDWNGAATVAAASMTFEELGERPLAEDCIVALEALQRDDGAYVHKAPGDSGADALLPWHTANAVLALRGFATPLSSPRIQRSLDWLRSSPPRRDDNSWGVGARHARVDVTSYVGRAFYAAKTPDADQIVDEIYNWLISTQGNKDPIGPLEGCLHAALFLADIDKMTSDAVLVGVPAPKVVEIQSVLLGLTTTINSLEKTITDAELAATKTRAELDASRASEAAAKDRLEAEIRDRRAGVTFSNKAVFIVGVALAIFSIVISIVMGVVFARVSAPGPVTPSVKPSANRYDLPTDESGSPAYNRPYLAESAP